MSTPPESVESLSKVDPLAILERLRREGRWVEAEAVKNGMLREARRQGMNRDEAQLWAYEQINQLYPPLEEGEDKPEKEGEGSVTPTDGGNAEDGNGCGAGAREGRVQGLGDLPATWPELPGNASQQAELAWVQAVRLDVIEERPSGAVVVHLDRADTPAPSKAALGWLETSIRSYAKYVDVVARGLRDEHDEAEHVRRERMAIAEIKALLAEMRGE
jgi:hypothetical protein